MATKSLKATKGITKPGLVKSVVAIGFRGMNNLPNIPAKLMDDERRIYPQIAMNVEITDAGKLRPRPGFTPAISLPGLHSLWSGSLMLGVAEGVLYRLEGETATALGVVDGPRCEVNYLEINNRVYMSNPYWKRTLNLLTSEMDIWGLAPPGPPDITMVAGNMAPGVYSLCYTNTQGDRMSGSGPVISIAWEGDTQGIRLNNLPSGGQCWITQPNGGKLFLARPVGGVITDQVPTIKPLPTLKVGPPPGFTHFTQAHGRMWGVIGKRLYYSDPFQYEWFRPSGYKPFVEDLVMVAPVMEGIFVSSLTSTWYLAGTSPAKMILTRVGEGAIPGTLVMAPLEAGHYTISRPQSMPPTPLWMSSSGLVGASHSGHLLTLTRPRLRINGMSRGASLFHLRDGIPQIITALRGERTGKVDTALEAIFARGRIFVPEPLELIGSGGVEISE